jgi:carbamoyltransferase
MYILGISCFYHDAAAALIEDGVLVAAAEEERFTRKKHDFSFPNHAINFCLKQAGITGDDLDYAVFYEKPLLKFERILMTCLAGFPRTWSVFRESMITWFNEKLWIKSQILDRLGIPADKLLFVEHHLSHAASAFFCSPFEEAAILTCDGVGEWTTAALGQARADWDGTGRNEIELFSEVKFPHSLGLLYSAFTAYLGFRVNNGEYKVMGMAPYGEPRYLDEVYKLIEVGDDGGFRLNMDYFSFHTSTQRTFNGQFVELFGPPRIRGSEFFTSETHPERDGAKARENQRYADIAASIQQVTEEVLLKMARYAYERTGLRQLCMAGGVALNSVANGRILTETPFQDVYIQPAAGDSGGALGAALYVYHVLFGKPRRFTLEHCFWGQEYSVDEIRAALDRRGLSYEWAEDEEKLTDIAVDALVEGKVVGWYQGRFEWGPRALGNRSILADPRRAEMKDMVNLKIKFREPFRPFAPVVLEERTGEYFDLREPARHYPARYMLLVTRIHEDKCAVIPAVTHVNGSARLQTIRREWNPRYCRVVEKFGEATGVPVLLNTSFNLRGEPIVNTPENALDTLGRSGMDMLVMDRFVVTKDR